MRLHSIELIRYLQDWWSTTDYADKRGYADIDCNRDELRIEREWFGFRVAVEHAAVGEPITPQFGVEHARQPGQTLIRRLNHSEAHALLDVPAESRTRWSVERVQVQTQFRWIARIHFPVGSPLTSRAIFPPTGTISSISDWIIDLKLGLGLVQLLFTFQF